MLKIEGLNAYYGKLQVLFNVSFDVGKEEIVIIVGPNGAGKSTLLKSIMNIEIFKKCEKMIFNGIDISKLPTFEIARHGIFYIPDYGGLLPGMTVFENLQLAAGKKNIYSRLELIKKVYSEIEKLLFRKADQLSGGERKIVSILRALLTDAKLLLLDEPTEGVAPIIFRNIINLIKEIIKEKRISIVWTEPGAKISKLLEIVDKLIILTAGRVSYIGYKDQIEKDLDKIKRMIFI
ncbi:MAG: ATP-binding cassette domain-containing protein [Candidatus Methanomethylicia archaeon]